MKNIYSHFLTARKKEKALALATIIATEGSSPQVPGASALFNSTGLLQGTVGGGILEADTQRAALCAMEKGSSLLLQVRLAGNSVSEEEAICGGEATVLVDVDADKYYETFLLIEKSLKRRIPGVLATFIRHQSGRDVSVIRQWTEKTQIFGDQKERRSLIYENGLKECLSAGKPKLLKSLKTSEDNSETGTLLYLEPLSPPSHLVIAGAGHIGRALTHWGSLLDFEVTVIDDRAEFANTKNLPEADRVIVGDIGRTIRSFPISEDTYLVIVTRGHSRDADALRESIGSQAAYIGMIGSAHKIELMRESFLQNGWATVSQWERIHSPIGIPIQSKTVQEIAVSIAAELVLVRNQVQDRLRGKA